MAKIHERAYVFGGPGQRKYRVLGKVMRLHGGVVDQIEITGVIFTIGNYGRTPAFIKQIEFGRCTEAEWPSNKYELSLFREDVLFPGKTSPDATNISYDTIGNADTHIFYGRITYLDVFKTEHHSVWRHRMVWRSDLETPDWESVALDGNATEWD